MAYEQLPTEAVREDGPELDLLAPAEIARLLMAEERHATRAVEGAIDSIGRACELAASAARLVYVGAGTSGRLGVLDAAEMGPTFGAAPGRVVGLLAGGPRALTEAVEGAEDDRAAGAAAFTARATDCVVGVSMSGTAAYVAGALAAARTAGASTVMITANPEAAVPADVRVVLDLGPELLAGSTRLKGGSATKAVLNMLSTAAMCRGGAVYGNLMVAVRPTNRKLRDRAERLVARIAGIERDRAARVLKDGGDDVRLAVLMERRGLTREQAADRLSAARGSLREALS
ncbi:MAG: N-acetylmuramic acid 6-phosphate etherase [Planctomycetota bacterium]